MLSIFNTIATATSQRLRVTRDVADTESKRAAKSKPSRKPKPKPKY